MLQAGTRAVPALRRVRVHGPKFVFRDMIFILVDQGHVPPDLTVYLVSWRFPLHGQTDPDTVSCLDRFHELQVSQSRIGQYRSFRRFNEQPGCEAEKQVAVRNASGKERVPPCAASSMWA